MKDKNTYSDSCSLGRVHLTFSSICRKDSILALPGSLLPGVFVYYILSDLLLMSSGISIPLAIIISILVFGLARYYTCGSRDVNIKDKKGLSLSPFTRNDQPSSSEFIEKNKVRTYSQGQIMNAIFVIMYLILLALAGLGSFYSPSFVAANKGLFITWEQLFGSLNGILFLSASIGLCFFLPGYAIAKMLSGRNNDYSNNTKSFSLALKQPLPKMLVAYLLSMLITGLTGYFISTLSDVSLTSVSVGEVTGFFVNTPNLTSLILLFIYGTILIFFVIHQKVTIIPVLAEVFKRYGTRHGLKSDFISSKSKLRTYLGSSGNS